MSKYETVIGLEVHAQLRTLSKMYCSCSTAFGDGPNTNICPVCTGHPGTLPVVNARAIELAIKAGLALGCEIQTKSVFSRKNYFYPDLPKAYQISQFNLPLCLGGQVPIQTEGEKKSISLTRIHLEEDAGKLLHDLGHQNESYVDFNRCGVGLIEIVSEPDMRSPKEAGDYLRTLRNILVYLDVCEGNLQEGNFRCDANVSIRAVGQEKLGTRTEMKNLNSFKAVERAIAYEVVRQGEVLEAGGEVTQETRLWNDAEGRTEPMRSKAEAHDYRYFPDPDLLPLIIEADLIKKIGGNLPELAGERADRFITEMSITEADAITLTDDKHIAGYFEAVVAAGAPAKKAANWILSELLRELNKDNREITNCPVMPEHLAELIGLIESGTISGKIAKDVFSEMYKTAEAPQKIVEAKGLVQMSDSSELEGVVDEIIAASPKQLEQYRSGKTAVLGFFVGQVMKATKGKANPKMVNEILNRKLSET
jgi:aspartyl-tRNA(Asn)/glutamyl-tRNA(Gln) amidotransferase subunit B